MIQSQGFATLKHPSNYPTAPATATECVRRNDYDDFYDLLIQETNEAERLANEFESALRLVLREPCPEENIKCADPLPSSPSSPIGAQLQDRISSLRRSNGILRSIIGRLEIPYHQ